MNEGFMIGFFIGAIILTRVISLIVEVPAFLIAFFVKRKYVLIAPILGAALTFIFVLAIYVFFPVRDKSLSSGNPVFEVSIYAFCILIWLLIDVLIVLAIKSISKPKLSSTTDTEI